MPLYRRLQERLWNFWSTPHSCTNRCLAITNHKKVTVAAGVLHWTNGQPSQFLSKKYHGRSRRKCKWRVKMNHIDRWCFSLPIVLGFSSWNQSWYVAFAFAVCAWLLKRYQADIGRCLGPTFGGWILGGGQGRIKWPPVCRACTRPLNCY